MCTSYFGSTDGKKITKQIANISLRSSMFQSKKRLIFMEELAKGFSWNFRQTRAGLDYDKKVKLNIWEMIFHPERYARYVAKIGIVLRKKRMAWIRWPICVLYYWYTLLCNKLRGNL